MKKHSLALFVGIIFAATSYWMAIINQPKEAGGGEREETQGRSGALEALDFWTRSRAYPDNDIPPDKYFQAFQYSKRTFKETSRSISSITAWQSIGPVNLAGRSISVAVNPQNPNTIYVGSASGGLWRSHTGGITGDWQRITTGYPVLGVSAIVIDPADSNTIYIGTGEVYRYQTALGGLVVRTTRGSFGMGILKTTDNGLTWTKSLDWSTQQQLGVEAVKMNPLNHHTLYAAASNGVYKTTNSGATWMQLVPAQMAEDILINPLDTNLVLLSTGNFGSGEGVFRSNDGGVSWNQVPTIPPYSGKTMLEMFGANPNIVFADVADSTTGVGAIYKSTNFGLSWSILNNNPGTYQVQGWYSHFVAAHPTDSSRIFQASVNAIKSIDGGTTWSGSGSGLYSDNHAYAHDPSNPNILYVADDDGIYRSTNFGDTFDFVGNNLQTGQFYNGFSNSASDSLLAVGQVQDHIPGYMYHGSTSWGRGANDEVGWTAIDPTDDSLMYAVSRNGQSVIRYVNRGLSSSGSVNFGGFGAWNSPLVLSPSNPNILYLGKDKIYRSVNSASSFSVTNGNVLIDGGNPALSMAMSSTNPDTVFVGTAPYITGAHLFRTTNGGSSWTNITSTLPNRYPLDIAVDPKNSRIVYVTFGGFGSHIFKSTDAGSGWTDISGTLPDVPTGAVFVDPLNSNYVYVGDDLGVFASTNGGTNWSSFSEGLPEAMLVSDLSYSPSNRTLRVTTHGNGIYQRKLEATLPAITLLTPNGGEAWEAGTTHQITWASGLIAAVRLDFSIDNGSTWIAISDNVPAGNLAYNWKLPKALTSQARVRVRSLADSVLSDQSNGTFTIFFNGSIITVRNGWNLISLPVTAADQRRSILFPTSISNAFDYDGNYHTKDTLHNGLGYWLKFGAVQQLSLAGNTFSADTIAIVTGWNLIGAISQSISVNSITSEPPGIVTSQFFGYNGAYITADSLRSAGGYWIKSSQDGQLILSSSSASPLTSKIRIIETTEIPPSAPADNITQLYLIPSRFELAQNYPNPFNPATEIKYQLSDRSQVTLKIFDLIGKEITTLVNETKEPGNYSASWNADNMPSGIYVYRLTAGNITQARKMLLVK
jgi:photosystem II stability/assembly factor-like uncharacterized protein